MEQIVPCLGILLPMVLPYFLVWMLVGVYFTSYTKYCLPYFASRNDPAVIVSYVNMGNVYPVTEHPKGEHSLVGASLMSGFNSHFVVVDSSGYPPNDESDPELLWDEIVVPQESQIVPVYLLRFDKFNHKKIATKWRTKRRAMSV
eukprot:TRINITY_DN8186_c0_g1_i1.p1 TRINITY_DN8186_c0_g1~~TRINITY_DN8186_c0_g1_i1.p1  ORF type:complete len:145 (-),score=26.77 TRINITY_DN8186_c0_g1_i1:77-511(-)